jgi:hypothetical protein
MRSLRLVAETDTVVVPRAIVVWTGEPTPNRRPVTSSLEQGREPPRAGKFRLGYAQARWRVVPIELAGVVCELNATS